MVRVGSEVKANYETLLDALTNEMQALHKELQECKEKLSQESCDDCISREAVSKLLNDGWLKGIYPSGAIMALPPVTPQPKMGRWVRMSDLSEDVDDRYKCSKCGNVVHSTDRINLYTFHRWCGRCGSNNDVAKM